MMKKIGLIGLIVLIGLIGNVHAQFGDYGVRVGFGYATIDDDMTTKSGILGAGIGGYINYNFKNTVLEEFFYLQSGLSFNRRGNSFEEVLETGTNIMIREGYIHAWYAQIPILACVHFELPVREVGHTVGFFIGPAINIGMFGPYNERKVTPFVSSPEANYDLRVHGTAADRDVFSHLSRFDVSAILGLSYERGPFTFTAYLDHGLIATSTGIDVLRVLENAQNSANAAANNSSNVTEINVKIPNGNNVAYMFSVGYKLGNINSK